MPPLSVIAELLAALDQCVYIFRLSVRVLPSPLSRRRIGYREKKTELLYLLSPGRAP